MVTFTLEYWQEDSWFIGHLREVPACFSQGETLQELEQNVAEVYQLLRDDSDFPVPSSVMTKAFPIAA